MMRGLQMQLADTRRISILGVQLVLRTTFMMEMQ